MTNEAIFVVGSTIQAVVSGSAGISDGAFNATAAVASIAAAKQADYPLFKAEARMAFSGTGSLDGGGVNLYIQKKGSGGWGPSPDVDHKHHFGGVFKVDKDNGSTEQVLTLDKIAAPVGQDYRVWVENNSGRNTGPGWDLDITPYTVKPQA